MLMIGKALMPEQRLTKAVSNIIGEKRYRALSQVMLLGSKSVVPVTDKIKTAATDGLNEYYNWAFVDDLSDPELRFLVLHECRHKMYKHLTIWDFLYKEDAQLANMACDYVINLEIVDENKDGFAVMPVWTQAQVDRLTPEERQQFDAQGLKLGDNMGLCEERFRGMNTKQVYDILKKEKEQRQQSGKGQQSGRASGVMDEHMWEQAQQMGEEVKQDIARQIDQALRQGALSAGKTGATVSRAVEKLLEPKVDRKELLRQFLTEHVAGRDMTSWHRPNRRFMSSGMYMPSLLSESAGELVFACDTSGSVTQKLLSEELGEVVALCRSLNPSKVHLLYWGHHVVAHELYGDGHTPVEAMVDSTKPAGGGGTMPQCIPDYMKENNIRPACVVVLTDGEFHSAGQWDVPVLWLVNSTRAALPSVGVSVRTTDD
jgi:predicted metal-dependent peptidase